MKKRILELAILAMAWGSAAMAGAAPRIAIIIDDVGDRYEEGRRTVELPGPVTTAFLPHTPHARELAEAAHRYGKPVMLHLPLQSLEGKELGPGSITLETTQQEFIRILADDLASIPHVEGVNNHMGSLLTRHPGHMTWLMQYLREAGNLYFIDSRTHRGTVAEQMANENGVPNARRDVFLDNETNAESIRAEFERLVALAKERGSAIGIGHPYPETLNFLAAELPKLESEYGVRLVPVSELLNTPDTLKNRLAGRKSEVPPATH